jgi:GNAT superfamily N-acetyltransferase
MANNVLTIRPYHGADEAELVALWNATMIYDRITPTVLRTKVLLDANFDPAGLLVAEVNGALVGFVLALVRQIPLFANDLEPEQGWITAFGVLPQMQRRGIGCQLFAAALEWLAMQGRKRVSISPYTPNYFTPGVDIDGYAAALAFLHVTGWQTVAEPLSMRVELTDFQLAPEILALEEQLRQTHGIVVRQLTAADLPQLRPFLVTHFDWEWYRFAQEYLLEFFTTSADQVSPLVAYQGDQLVGYCQHRRERFGPFGIAPALRNYGVGRVMLGHCLQAMRTKGFHCAWFLWTGADGARFYTRAGFRVARRFALLQKAL